MSPLKYHTTRLAMIGSIHSESLGRKGQFSPFGLLPARPWRRWGVLCAQLALAACCGCGGRPAGAPPRSAADDARPQARFVQRVEWAGRGRWLKAGTHMHTRFSDGSHELAEVVEQAVRFGCDVIAITDHADRELQAASPEYIQAVRAARQQHPGRVILAGLEWNVPPWDGREHATVLISPGAVEGRILEQFKARFDDWGRGDHPPALAEEGLRWLAQQSVDGAPLPLVLYNHPLRKRSGAGEFIQEYRRLHAASDRLVGFSGAPGHQRRLPTEEYQGESALVDRWDPAVAVVGGGWDALLGQGVEAWAARDASDFHDTDNDYWPGEFAETWLYAPDMSASGVFRALEAGTFFAAHGHLVRQVQLKVSADGLDRAAVVGEAIEVPAGTTVEVELEFQVPGQDWEGKPNRVDELELIGVLPSGSVVLAQSPPQSTGPAMSAEVRVEAGGVVLRARGRRVVPDGPDLLFYTNPIRVRTAPAEAAGRGRADVKPVTPVQQASDTSGLPVSRTGIWLWLATGPLVLAGVAASAKNALPRDAAQSPGAKAVAVAGRDVFPRRLHFAILASLAIAVAVYGSLVPLHFRPLGVAEAWSQFQKIPFLTLGVESRADWVANILLFVPIGFLAMGALTVDRRNVLGKVASVICVVAAGMTLSVALEFTQLWFPPRTVSQNDIAAECLGAIVGTLFWLIVGQSFTDWIRSYVKAHTARDQVAWLLEAYLVGLLIYSVLPLDLTIHPSELGQKFVDGKVALVPFADITLTLAYLYGLARDFLVFLPVGMWIATWRTGSASVVRSVPVTMFWGGVIAGAIEAAQLFVYSRFTSTQDVLLGTLAAGAGGAIMRRWRGTAKPGVQETAGPHLGWAMGSFSVAVIYAGVLVLMFCAPYEVLRDPVVLRQRFEHFLAIPFAALYWGSEYNAISQVVYKLLWFAPLGVLLTLSVEWLPTPRRVRAVLLLAALLAAVAIALGVELLQVFFPPHVPDITDVLLYSGGSATGMFVTHRVCTARRHQHATPP